MAFYCIFSAQYLPTVGGVENFSQNIASRLKKLGHRVAIITSAIEGLPETEVDSNGVELVRVPTVQLIQGRFPVVWPNKKTAELINELLVSKDCRVIVNTRFYPLSLYAVRAAKKFNCPSIVIEHGSAHLSLGSAVVDFAVRIYEHAFAVMVKRYCDNFYAVSSRSRDWLRHFKISAKGVIFNAIDIDELDAIPNGLFPLSDYNLTDRDRLICYVGRMIPEKGVKQLVEAFNEFYRNHPEHRLVMAGDGPLLTELKQTAEEGVVFCGRLSRDCCVALLKRSEIFCLPTVSEGFSTTLLEAAAAGCFIVTTEGCGGAVEVFGNSDDAIITAGNTKAEIISAFVTAIHLPDREQRTKRVRARIKKELGWETSCKTIEELDW